MGKGRALGAWMAILAVALVADTVAWGRVGHVLATRPAPPRRVTGERVIENCHPPVIATDGKVWTACANGEIVATGIHDAFRLNVLDAFAPRAVVHASNGSDAILLDRLVVRSAIGLVRTFPRDVSESEIALARASSNREEPDPFQCPLALAFDGRDAEVAFSIDRKDVAIEHYGSDGLLGIRTIAAPASAISSYSPAPRTRRPGLLSAVAICGTTSHPSLEQRVRSVVGTGFQTHALSSRQSRPARRRDARFCSARWRSLAERAERPRPRARLGKGTFSRRRVRLERRISDHDDRIGWLDRWLLAAMAVAPSFIAFSALL